MGNSEEKIEGFNPAYHYFLSSLYSVLEVKHRDIVMSTTNVVVIDVSLFSSGGYITFLGSVYSLLEVNHRDVVMSTTTTTNEVSSCLVWLKKGH